MDIIDLWNMEQGNVEQLSNQIKARNIAFHAAYSKAIGEGYDVARAEKIASEEVKKVLRQLADPVQAMDDALETAHYDEEYNYHTPTTLWHFPFTDRQFARLLILKSKNEELELEF